MRVAIIPYRDRAKQLAKLIPALLEKGIDRIVVCEQSPNHSFNRGLIKNLGVLLGELDDKDTIYLHDVDLLPGPELRTYPPTTDTTVIHLYGHRHCLGGVVGMTVKAFKKVGGFCNDLWTWGGEDYALEKACEHADMMIDRRWFRQRFTADDWFSEMDKGGHPMKGPLARRLFTMDFQRSDRKVERREFYAPGYMSALENVLHYNRTTSKVDPRILWVSVDLRYSPSS